MNDFCANLAGIRWHFRECGACNGVGSVRRERRRTTCLECRGTGQHRTIYPPGLGEIHQERARVAARTSTL